MANSLKKLTLADLVLIRLAMPTKTPPSPAAILKDLGPMIKPALTKERLKAVLDDFRGAKSYLPAKGQQLNEEGRKAALAILGRTELPPKCNWGTIKAKFLIPQAFGLTPWSEAEIKRVNSADNLAARLLIQKYDLQVSVDSNLSAAMEALVCKLLGRSETSLKQLASAVISKQLDQDLTIPPEALNKIAPGLLLGVKKKGVDGLRGLVLNDRIEDKWEPSKVTPTAEPETISRSIPTDLASFVEKVTDAAKTCPTGWTGDQLVLISHVWKHYKEQGHSESLEAFKKKLVDAHRERVLTLSRADFPQTLNSQEFHESETIHGVSVYHFIKIARG